MSGEDRELNKLYRMVEDEILERQEYLEEIAHLSEPALKSKIKMEIVERVHELEKIIKLLNSKWNNGYLVYIYIPYKMNQIYYESSYTTLY